MENYGTRFWDRLRSLFGFTNASPAGTGETAPLTAVPKKGDVKVVRLNGASKLALSKALRALEPGQKGWISFDDAARLFSTSTKKPREGDEDRIKALAEFASDIEHRSSHERNEVDERVYFIRIRTLIV